MSTIQGSPEAANLSSGAAARDFKLEVVAIPVSDVDRAKDFYQRLGWRLDADFSSGDWRLVQMTPPGSACSVMFGEGFTAAAPGSVQGTFLVVDDIEAARAELVRRDVAVSEVFHFENNRLQVLSGEGHLPGLAPERHTYFSFATFRDPDGNGWLLQEVTARLPGRGLGSFDVATLSALLREAEAGHRVYERTSPPHHWSGWYAGYIVARQRGKGAEEAVQAGSAQIEVSK